MKELLLREPLTHKLACVRAGRWFAKALQEKDAELSKEYLATAAAFADVGSVNNNNFPQR